MVKPPRPSRSSSAESASSSTKLPLGPQVNATSLEYNPEERKQTNIALVEHMIGKGTVASSTSDTKSDALKNPSPPQTESKPRRLKLKLKKGNDKPPPMSVVEAEKNAKTLDLLQKINVSLTQEVTMLREQRDQAMEAYGRLSKLSGEKEEKGVLNDNQNSVIMSDANLSLDDTTQHNISAITYDDDSSLVVSGEKEGPTRYLDEGSKVVRFEDTAHTSSNVPRNNEESLSYSLNKLGSPNEAKRLEMDNAELREKLTKKEKTISFFRMELLEAKDITKKEVSSLQSEIQHLKRQNVVNANRVVVLEDELKSIREGRDEENTAEVIQSLEDENTNLKLQVERSLENMRNMSASLKRKEENEIELKRKLKESKFDELESREELESCRKAQQQAIIDCAKLRDQVDTLTSNNKSLNSEIKSLKVKTPVRPALLPAPIFLQNGTISNEAENDTNLEQSFGNTSQAATPKAVNTIASHVNRSEPTFESDFLSCLADINDTLDIQQNDVQNIKGQSKSVTRPKVEDPQMKKPVGPALLAGPIPAQNISKYKEEANDMKSKQSATGGDSEAETPKAVNTVANSLNRFDLNIESDFMSCLANINHTLNNQNSGGNSKTSPSRSVLYTNTSQDNHVSPMFPPTLPPTLPPTSLNVVSMGSHPPVTFESQSIAGSFAMNSESVSYKNNRASFGSRSRRRNLQPTLPKVDDDYSEGTAAFNDEIEEISVAYDSISRQPRRHVLNKKATMNVGEKSKLVPFRLPSLSQANKTFSEEDDVMSVNLVANKRDFDKLVGPVHVPVPTNTNTQEQELSDVLSGMLSLLDTTVEAPPTQEKEQNIHNKRDAPEKVERSVEQTASTSTGSPAPGIKPLTDIDTSSRIPVKDAVEDMEKKVSLSSDLAYLKEELEKSKSNNQELEKQNLFIKQNYNDTVELLQKEADDNLRLKEESESKFEEERFRFKEITLQREFLLKSKVHEYEATLEVFEHAVASQSAVINELITNLEKQQFSGHNYKEENAESILSRIDKKEEDSVVALPCEEKIVEGFDGEENNIQSIEEGHYLEEKIVEGFEGEEINIQSVGEGHYLEVKDILLAEDGTPIVVKEIVSSGDVLQSEQQQISSGNIGMMRAWKNETTSSSNVSQSSENQPNKLGLSILSSVLERNKSNEDARKKLESRLTEKHITVEALSEAATQANEALRDIMTQLASKTEALDFEVARRAQAEKLLEEHEEVIIAVSNAITEQESIMTTLEAELEEIQVVDISGIDLNIDLAELSRGKSKSERLIEPVIESSSTYVACSSHDEKDRKIRELEVAIEEGRAIEVTLAEDLTKLRDSVLEIETHHKSQIEELQQEVDEARMSVQKMETKVKLMTNNTNSTIKVLHMKLDDESSPAKLVDELSTQIKCLEYKESLLADELNERLESKENTNKALAKVENLCLEVQACLRKCESNTTSTENTSVFENDEFPLDMDNHVVTVIDTQLLTDINDQLTSLHEFEEKLKYFVHKFESDSEVTMDGFGMSRGDRRTLRKLREEFAMFLEKSRASLHELEAKVADYIGSIGEERWSRIKELESQLDDKEKTIKMMEKQNTYLEQALSNMKSELHKAKKGRSGLFR